MRPIEFYYMPESPPCRAVEMVAKMVGVELNKRYINLFTKENMKEEYSKVNPLHKVPFIIDGNLKLGESRAIMTYLVNKYKPDDEHLYPKDPAMRARVDELLYYDIGTLFQAGATLLRPILFGPAKEFDPEAEKAFKATVQYLDKRLANNGASRFMLGNYVTVADISLAASLGMSIDCGVDLTEFSHVISYLERLKAAIPSYSAINDAASESSRKFWLSRKEANRQS